MFFSNIWNGLNIFPISSSLNPIPESDIFILILLFIFSTDNSINPFIVNLYEFDIKFIITCFKRISEIAFIFLSLEILFVFNLISMFFFSNFALDWNILTQKFKEFIKLNSSFSNDSLFIDLNLPSFLLIWVISYIKFIPKSQRLFRKFKVDSSSFSFFLLNSLFCNINSSLFSIYEHIVKKTFFNSCALLAKYKDLILNSFWISIIKSLLFLICSVESFL